MGRDIDATAFTAEERARYRDKVKADLAALAQLVAQNRLRAGGPAMGMEMELYLIDDGGRPAPRNAEVLERLPSTHFQTELARFNLEVDLDPRPLPGVGLAEAQAELAGAVSEVEAAAAELGVGVLPIGILPTLAESDLTLDSLSANPRYRALNDAIMAARGEDLTIRIEGTDTLATTSSSILFEAACTSLQLHLDVAPRDFARYWNAAQAAAAPLVAAGANSPLLLGRELHHETRIALFQQAIDTRPEELSRQGVRPRVWFGERWLSEGMFELFDENVRYFPALLPLCFEEDPLAVLAVGKVPELPELALHNGTIYRWNRPVYAVNDGVPTVRIENRVLPAGPTSVDAIANAALFYGLVRGLADAEPPVWRHMSFEAAETNFYAAARDGLDAQIYWPGHGARVPVTELLTRHLLPLARAGLAHWGVSDRDAEHYLDIIAGRALTGRNGASWQIAAHRRLREQQGLAAPQAASELVRRYAKHAATGEPVHTWEL